MNAPFNIGQSYNLAENPRGYFDGLEVVVGATLPDPTSLQPGVAISNPVSFSDTEFKISINGLQISDPPVSHERERSLNPTTAAPNKTSSSRGAMMRRGARSPALVLENSYATAPLPVRIEGDYYVRGWFNLSIFEETTWGRTIFVMGTRSGVWLRHRRQGRELELFYDNEKKYVMHVSDDTTFDDNWVYFMVERQNTVTSSQTCYWHSPSTRLYPFTLVCLMLQQLPYGVGTGTFLYVKGTPEPGG